MFFNVLKGGPNVLSNTHKRTSCVCTSGIKETNIYDTFQSDLPVRRLFSGEGLRQE